MFSWFKKLRARRAERKAVAEAAAMPPKREPTPIKPTEYDEVLEKSFTELVLAESLDIEGSAEYYTDIFEPQEFCVRAFEYCGEQFDALDNKEMLFEYPMTAFYGAFCTSILWRNHPEYYTGEKSTWDLLTEQMSPEFVLVYVNDLLGIPRESDLSRNFFRIICKYKETTDEVITKAQRNRHVCLCAMRYCYRLGMLVARRELEVQTERLTREALNG